MLSTSWQKPQGTDGSSTRDAVVSKYTFVWILIILISSISPYLRHFWYLQAAHCFLTVVVMGQSPSALHNGSSGLWGEEWKKWIEIFFSIFEMISIGNETSIYPFLKFFQSFYSIHDKRNGRKWMNFIFFFTPSLSVSSEECSTWIASDSSIVTASLTKFLLTDLADNVILRVRHHSDKMVWNLIISNINCLPHINWLINKFYRIWGLWKLVSVVGYSPSYLLDPFIQFGLTWL